MRSHSPDPRSPLRRMGYKSRSGESSWTLQALPFWQVMGFMSGTPSSICSKMAAGSSNRIFPSREYTRYGQVARQLRQCVPKVARSQLHRWRYWEAVVGFMASPSLRGSGRPKPART